MVQKTVKGTRLRNGRYYFNLTIPAGIRHLYRAPDGKERALLTDTLDTADPKIAEQKVTVQKARFIEEAAAEGRKNDLSALLDDLTPEQKAIYTEAGGLEGLLQKHERGLLGLKFLEAGKPHAGEVIDVEGGDESSPPVKVQVLDGPDDDDYELEAITHETKVRQAETRAKGTGRVLKALGRKVSIPGDDVITLPDAAEFFLKTGGYTVQNAASMRYALRRWQEYHGNLALAEITREHLSRFDEAAMGIPVSAERRIRSMPMRRAIEEAKAKKLPTIAQKSRVKMLDHAKTAMRNALDKGKGGLKYDPFAGYRPIAVKGTYSEQKEAKIKGFSPDEVRRILEIVEETRDPQHIDYWLPWLAAYSGARREEIGQLMVNDVLTIDGIPALRITDLDPIQKLKTAHSLRVIPVPPAVIAKGFLDYVEARRVVGGRLLFTETYEFKTKKVIVREMTPDKKGRLTESYGGRFTKYILKPYGLKIGRGGVHRLRHSWTDSARRAGIHSDIRRMIAGRLEGEDPVEAGYGGGSLMKEKLAAMIEVENFVGK